ncbi:hypothetical protein BST61_g5183 [Cercospora zeina]
MDQSYSDLGLLGYAVQRGRNHGHRLRLTLHSVKMLVSRTRPCKLYSQICCSSTIFRPSERKGSKSSSFHRTTISNEKQSRSPSSTKTTTQCNSPSSPSSLEYLASQLQDQWQRQEPRSQQDRAAIVTQCVNVKRQPATQQTAPRSIVAMARSSTKYGATIYEPYWRLGLFIAMYDRT